MDLLAFPFALNLDGTVATVPQGSEDDARQAILTLLSTRTGERTPVPTFGVPDLTFGNGDPGVPQAAVNAGLERFGPTDVTIVTATTRPQPGTSTAELTLGYQIGTL